MRAKRLFFVLLSVLIACAALFYLDQQVLLVDEVVVTGCQLIHPEDVVSFSGVRPGQSLLQLRRGVVAQNVCTIPYIQSAQVAVQLNGRVVINVTERAAAGYMVTDEGYVLLDTWGHVLEIRSSDEGLIMPQITGLVYDTPKVDEPLAMPAYDELPTKEERKKAQEDAQLHLAVASRALEGLAQGGAMDCIREIDVSQPWELRMVTREGIEVLFGMPEDLPTKSSRLAEALQTIRYEGYTSGTLDVALVDAPMFHPTSPGFDQKLPVPDAIPMATPAPTTTPTTTP